MLGKVTVTLVEFWILRTCEMTRRGITWDQLKFKLAKFAFLSHIYLHSEVESQADEYFSNLGRLSVNQHYCIDNTNSNIWYKNSAKARWTTARIKGFNLFKYATTYHLQAQTNFNPNTNFNPSRLMKSLKPPTEAPSNTQFSQDNVIKPCLFSCWTPINAG